MKLELQHLAPYLPYNLNVIYRNRETSINIVELVDKKYISLQDFTHEHKATYEKIKPILRPLSDLTKEIEVNGEKFVPLDELRKMFTSNIIISTNNDGNIRLWLSQKTSAELNILTISNIREKLLEWHFDVFELIPEGLAIDINTLK